MLKGREDILQGRFGKRGRTRVTPRWGGASAGRGDSDGSRGDRRMPYASKCSLEPAAGHGSAARVVAHQGSRQYIETRSSAGGGGGLCAHRRRARAGRFRQAAHSSQRVWTAGPNYHSGVSQSVDGTKRKQAGQPAGGAWCISNQPGRVSSLKRHRPAREESRHVWLFSSTQ